MGTSGTQIQTQTPEVQVQSQTAREECVYVLKVVKTRGRDKIIMLKQPDPDSDCRMFPKWFYRWLEVEPWTSDIRKLVYDLQERKGYVILEVRGKYNIQFGKTEPNEPALYVWEPRIVE